MTNDAIPISAKAAIGFQINKSQVLITSGIISVLVTVHNALGFKTVAVEICNVTIRNKANDRINVEILYDSREILCERI